MYANYTVGSRDGAVGLVFALTTGRTKVRICREFRVLQVALIMANDKVTFWVLPILYTPIPWLEVGMSRMGCNSRWELSACEVRVAH